MPKAPGYEQSLEVLKACKRLSPRTPTKSSLMLGLGETREEVLESFADLRAAGTDILTLGQYLRPTTAHRHLDVVEFVTPETFDAYGASALPGLLIRRLRPLRAQLLPRRGAVHLKGLLKRLPCP